MKSKVTDVSQFNPGDYVWFFTDRGPRRGLLVKISVEHTLRDVSEKYFTTRAYFSVIEDGEQFPKMHEDIYSSIQEMADSILVLKDPAPPKARI